MSNHSGQAPQRRLVMYVIYDSPRDYPGEFVCRQWFIGAGAAVAGDLLARGKLIEAIQEQLAAKGLCRWLRDPADDPCIVETWF